MDTTPDIGDLDRRLGGAGVLGGGAAGWFEALLSGAVANWLVGMAAFFATMGRTIFGRCIPVLLAVSTLRGRRVPACPRKLRLLLTFASR